MQAYYNSLGGAGTTAGHDRNANAEEDAGNGEWGQAE